MATVEKLSISITPEFASDIRGVIATGEYASTSEVIRDALRAWKQTRQNRAAAIEAMSKLWRQGLESGESKLPDANDIKRRGRERLARLQSTGD